MLNPKDAHPFLRRSSAHVIVSAAAKDGFSSFLRNLGAKEPPPARSFSSAVASGAAAAVVALSIVRACVCARDPRLHLRKEREEEEDAIS